MKNLTLSDFIKIFEYGNENSGLIMYDRFTKRYGGNVAAFFADLCDIDARKWQRYFAKK